MYDTRRIRPGTTFKGSGNDSLMKYVIIKSQFKIRRIIIIYNYDCHMFFRLATFNERVKVNTTRILYKKKLPTNSEKAINNK